MSIHIPHAVASLVSGLAVLLLWGPATGLGSLAAFAALWGAFVYSYSVSWTKIAAGMSEREEDAAGATMTLYAWFSFERGLSDILAGPISSVLLRRSLPKVFAHRL